MPDSSILGVFTVSNDMPREYAWAREAVDTTRGLGVLLDEGSRSFENKVWPM
jgi:hypothetical protein